MGVSGSGKTTIGTLLATRLGWTFYDADDFHPPVNVDKMRRGIPLTEADRMPWLTALHKTIAETNAAGRSAVLACSALTRFDRDLLLQDDGDISLVYLYGNYDLIKQRMEARHGHFFRPELLASQFAALQEPEGAFVVDVSQTPEVIVDAIIDHIKGVAPSRPV
jgi:gluconokinase